jgi:hypothetical protein
MRADDLLCSPNAHTRSVVSLDRRCSSKRALGGQSALPQKGEQETWKRSNFLGTYAAGAGKRLRLGAPRVGGEMEKAAFQRGGVGG